VGTAIAGYTVVDGIGVRAADSVAGYMAWPSLGLSTITATLLSARRAVRIRMRAERVLWPRAVLGALLSTTAYSLVIWSQAHASVALVAALRETSVVFAALIGVVVFGEDVCVRRIFASAGVAAGLALLHLT
jgi:drug/metabolite transporter (DMT)-like permease